MNRRSRRNLKRPANKAVKGKKTESGKRAVKAGPSNASVTKTETIESMSQSIADLEHQLAEVRQKLAEAQKEMAEKKHDKEKDKRSSFKDEPGKPLERFLELFLNRQRINSKLPKFDGNLRDWPMFIKKFETTTQECEFTDHENIHRLQDSLSGPALDLVRYNLLQGKDVHWAIKTLRDNFGHPRIILNEILQDAMRMPRIKPDLGNFSAFVAESHQIEKIINLVDDSNISELILLQLEKRLPPWLVLQWASEKPNTDQHSLFEFIKWISTILTITRATGMVFHPQRDVNRVGQERNRNFSSWSEDEDEIVGEDFQSFEESSSLRNMVVATNDHRIIMDNCMEDVMSLQRLESDLRNLPDFVAECQRIERAIGLYGGRNISELILLRLEQQLPPSLSIEWRSQRSNTDYQGLSEFIRWLRTILTLVRAGGRNFYLQ